MSNVTGNSSVVCDGVIVTDYDAVIAAVAAILCLFGLVYTFFGYRCFKAVMFLSGLIFGGTTVFLMCREERLFQQSVSLEMAAGIAAGIGTLCGFITMLVRYVGLFLQGFFLGMLVAIAGILALQSFYHPVTAWIPVGIIFGTGVLCALLTLKYQKQLVIVSTAVLGSALITVCIDYFIEKFLLSKYAWEALMAAPTASVCWYTWVILSVWPALSFSGSLVQWKVTAKGYDHTDVIIVRGRRKQVRTHLVREHPSQQVSRTTRGSNRTSGATRGTRRTASRPQQPRSSQRRQEPERRRVAPVVQPPPPPHNNNDAMLNTDTSPPSYFECMQLGVGEPVTDRDTIVHTNTGAYVSRPPQRNMQDDLLHGVSSGSGYVIEASQLPSTSRGYVENAQLRNNQRQGNRRTNLTDPNHQNIDQFSAPRENRVDIQRPINQINNQHSSQAGRVGRRTRVSPSLQASRTSSHHDQGGESDTQSLLSQPPKGNREAVAAHARRILAAQNRRSSRQGGGSPRSSVAAQGSNSGENV